MRIVIWVCLACVIGSLMSCSPLPAHKMDDLALYRFAMRPETQFDLDELGPLPRYKIRISVDPAQLTLLGHETVTYTNRQPKPLSEVYFRLLPNLPAFDGDLQVTKVQVAEREVSISYEANRSALRVVLPSALGSGRTVRMEIDFILHFKQKNEGRVLLGKSEAIISLPDFYPILAVCENGSWNLSIGPEFADASFAEISLYEVTILVPKGMTVVTTGVVKSESDTMDGKRLLETVTGPVREFALIMSTRYQKQMMTVRGVEVNSYTLPEDAQSGYSALWRASSALEVFEDVFGFYPYTKLDVVEAPLLKHGMEYPALLFIGAEVYRSERKRLEPLVVHETAHQWWYNIVGSDPVNHPAVDEGLAEYSLYLYAERMYGRRKADALLNERWAGPFEVAKEAGLDAAAAGPAAAFNKDNYEVIVYAKSALLFHQLRQYVGDEAFNLAVRRYLKNYRYRIAPPGALLGLAAGITPKNLDRIAQQWHTAATATPSPAPKP